MNATEEGEARLGREDHMLNARGRVSEYFNRSSQRSSSFWSLAKSIAYGKCVKD